MIDNEIVKEVRKARESILESHNWDIDAMMRDSIKHQWESGREIVNLGKKSIEQGVASNAYPLRRQA